jgi:hypothetical protein
MGWYHVCLDCWQEAFPTEYAPVAEYWDKCEGCGQLGLTTAVRGLMFAAIRAVIN